MTLEWIRFVIAAVLIALGLCAFTAAVLGAYRFGFVMNRMHAAGIGDTAGIFLVIASLAVARGFEMDTLKLVILVFFLWFTSPVSTHFLGQVEYYTNPVLRKYVGKADPPERVSGKQAKTQKSPEEQVKAQKSANEQAKTQEPFKEQAKGEKDAAD